MPNPDLRKDATDLTLTINAKFSQDLPFDHDNQDFQDADRGFIAPLPNNGVIKDDHGFSVWDVSQFSRFIQEGAPAPQTVNPSLWRQSQLVIKAGLYKVCESEDGKYQMYQVRNADLSNLTIVEGDEGIIIFDPLVSKETAKAALDLYYEHRPKKVVKAVIYSHSHVDHYGGVKGVASQNDVDEGRTIIIAPEGFLEAAVAENVLAGNVMSRRAAYMYGNLLPIDPKGQVGSGLGMTTSAGEVTMIPPTDTITASDNRRKIDGLDFEFMMAPDTEAPAEMHWYIVQLKAVTAAENCCHTLHNTYSLRGTKIRDPLAWSKYLQQTITLWGNQAEVMYGMHHWPVWGNDRVLETLRKARDGYRYINDQTLRLANHGYTPAEIAEQLEFPPEIATHWAMRGYYGSMNHNVRATYVKYLGWFDGNPANLHTLPPVEASQRYVRYMGGAEVVLDKARADFNNAQTKEDYRWIAEVVNHVVFADPSNQTAHQLQADVLEQLGYQAESGPWRNFYLSGAQELRYGIDRQSYSPKGGSSDAIPSMTIALIFDYLGVLLNGEKAAGKHLKFRFVFTDTHEDYILTLENAALSYQLINPGEHVDVSHLNATFTLTRSNFNDLLSHKAETSSEKIEKLIDVLKIRVEPPVRGRLAFIEFITLLDHFDFWFNIIEP